jgi:hypothetical protein
MTYLVLCSYTSISFLIIFQQKLSNIFKSLFVNLGDYQAIFFLQVYLLMMLFCDLNAH